MIDLNDFKTGLGEIRSRIGSSLEEEKERIVKNLLIADFDYANKGPAHWSKRLENKNNRENKRGI